MDGAREGMQTLNQALRNMVEQRVVAYDDAVAKSPNDKELAQLLGKSVPA